MTSTIIIDPMETDGPKCQRVLFDNDWLGERIWPIYKLDYDGPEIEDGDESVTVCESDPTVGKKPAFKFRERVVRKTRGHVYRSDAHPSDKRGRR